MSSVKRHLVIFSVFFEKAFILHILTSLCAGRRIIFPGMAFEDVLHELIDANGYFRVEKGLKDLQEIGVCYIAKSFSHVELHVTFF